VRALMVNVAVPAGMSAVQPRQNEPEVAQKEAREPGGGGADAGGVGGCVAGGPGGLGGGGLGGGAAAPGGEARGGGGDARAGGGERTLGPLAAGGGSAAGVPPPPPVEPMTSVADTLYQIAKDCTTKPESVTEVTPAAGVNENVTASFKLGSLCPKPQEPYATL
jgi:hypothetical protein